MDRRFKSSPGGSSAASLIGTERALGKRSLVEGLPARYRSGPPTPYEVQAAATQGTVGAGDALPYLGAIQRSFGHHDVSGVAAHTGGAASAGAQAIGAEAFAVGDHVVFDGAPDLHTVAHEAAHVVQQRGGVQLKGGLGEEDDAHERHADEVADLVVQGRSAAHLLDAYAGTGSGGGGGLAVQAKFNRTLRKQDKLEDKREEETKDEVLDLDGLSLDDIEKLLEQGRLELDEKLAEYLIYRARKDFYSQVHVVYDLDETLVGHTVGTYAPSKDHREVGGVFEPDKEGFDYPIHGIAPAKPLSGDYTSQFTPISEDRRSDENQWRMRYREKDLRERGESQKGSDRRGGDDEEISKDIVKDNETITAPKKETIVPSNLKETPNLKGFSVRPGAIENLNLYHQYGIKQSTWTANSDHHSHRVHELLAQQGFAEQNFSYRHNRETQTDKGDKPLEKLRDKGDMPSELTVLLDDQTHAKSNTNIGNVQDEKYGSKDSLEKDQKSDTPHFLELRMPPFADPKDRKKQKTDHLGGLLGERMLFKLAMLQKQQKSKVAERYLTALRTLLGVKDEKELPEAFFKFIEEGGDSKLQQQFEKFQPKSESKQESLFALTPSLGASLLLPAEKKDEKDQKDQNYVEDKSGNAYTYKPSNLISRGLVETVTREEESSQKRYVRVYQTLVNQVETKDVDYKKDESIEDKSGRKNKDIHQDKETGELHLIKGTGAVCYSVGTPLRAIKWIEKYHHEHKENDKIKGFVPVIRSFLLPLDVYLSFSSKAMVQEQMSHERYKGKESSPNVDIAGDTDQYEMRDSDFENFKLKSLKGSLVTWTEAPGKINVDVSGEVHELRELYGQLGIPYFPGIFTPEYNPFISNKKHREGGSAKKLAGELGDAYASHLEQGQGRDVESLSSNQYVNQETRKKTFDKVVEAHFGKDAKDRDERIQRIHEERLRRIRQLEKQSTKPPVTWTNDEDGAKAFFLDEILPAGATQAEIISTINENLEGERSELTLEHPEYGKSKEVLVEELDKNTKHLPDTETHQVDFEQLKQENQEIREKGKALSEIISEVILDGSCDAQRIVDGFLKLFPELEEKFDVDSNEGEYKFYEHAQAVIGQYLKYFAAQKHPLISADSMIKMILFHDMDKRLGRAKLWKGMKEFHEKGTGYPEESAKEVHRHLPHSRAELAKKFASVDEKESEHVLPALMMQKYAPLWQSSGEAQLALQMMNGDPIGECLKSKDKDIKEAFRNILKMAHRCGIPYHDYAGLRAFFYELAQFYQSDSSAYSSDSRFTTYEKEEKRGIGKGPHGQVYMETLEEEGKPGDKSQKLLTPDKKTGFIPFRVSEQGEAFQQLLELFADPSKTVMEIVREEKHKRGGNGRGGGKKREKAKDIEIDLEGFFSWLGDEQKKEEEEEEEEGKGLEGASTHHTFTNTGSTLTSFHTKGGGDCGIHALLGTPQTEDDDRIACPDVDQKRLELSKAIALQCSEGRPHRARYILLLSDLASRLYQQYLKKAEMTSDDEALWKAFLKEDLLDAIANVAKEQDSAYRELGKLKSGVVKQYLKVMKESGAGSQELVAFLVQEVLKSNAESDEKARGALKEVESENQAKVLLSQEESYLEELISSNLEGLLQQGTQVKELAELCQQHMKYDLDLSNTQSFFVEFATKHLESLLEAYASAVAKPGFFLREEDLRVLADLEGTGFTLYQEHDTHVGEYMVVDSYETERGDIGVFHNGTNHYERAQKK